MPRILLVEDEEHLAEGIRFNLELDGCEVETIGDGLRALERLLPPPDGGPPPPPFDLVLLDVMLPGLDGFQVVDRMRQAGNFTPVLMLTAKSMPEDVVEGLEAGADDYLAKPFDLPVKLAVDGDTVRLTFSRPLDAASVKPEHFRAAWWNYHWSGDYGSKRWKVSKPSEVGQDDVPVRGVELRDGGRTVVLRFDRVRPVMQMQVAYNVTAGNGRTVVGSVFLTIHDTGKE